MRFAAEGERLCARASALRTALVPALHARKAVGDTRGTRALGSALNALVALAREAAELDAPVRGRLTLASRRLDAYRARCAVRPLSDADAAALCAVAPDRSGYERVLDFYRLTDAARFSFGRALSGAQHFTDVRRNVAIVRADGCIGGVAGVFEAYAVSGERAPGLNLRDDEPRPFRAIACADGLGEVYERTADAEYKLLTALCVRALGVRGSGGAAEAAAARAYAGSITLWSKKPLCASCSAVAREQLRSRLPNATVRVLVDEDESVPDEAEVSRACAPSPAAAATPRRPDGEGKKKRVRLMAHD